MRAAKKEAKARSWRWLAPAGVAVCVLVAYCNSFSGPFIYDDLDSIRNNPDFGGQKAAVSASGRTLSPVMTGGPPASTTLTNRPILWLSLYLDYLLDGRDERGILDVGVFHVTNLAIHLCSALLMYGIVRRTLGLKFWGGEFEASSAMLAAGVAAIWAVHPLNTESVTYIVQRAESLAGMFYLGVMYCLIRGGEGRGGEPRRREGAKTAAKKDLGAWWYGGAVGCCVLGVCCKEILVTAPVVAWIYDRTFLAGGFGAALRARWKLYLGLAGSWVLIAALIVAGSGRGHSVGFGLGISAMDYARTSLVAIGHYLRLTFWPTGLTLSLLDWPLAKSWGDVGVGGAMVIVLVFFWVVALWRWPVMGFLGAWFFLILAPSQSFVPIISEKISEHRMYLSLAAPVALVVIGGWRAARRFGLAPLAIGVDVGLLGVCVGLTILRNNDYRTAVSIWTDNVAKRPNNPQAQYHLGYAWFEIEWALRPGSEEKQLAARQAAEHIQKAYDLLPGDSIAQLLGHLLIDSGRPAEAEKWYDMMVENYPRLAFESHMMRGQLRGERNDFADAKADLQAAIAADPKSAEAHFLLGYSMERLGDAAGAREEFERALRIKPGYADPMRELDRLNGK